MNQIRIKGLNQRILGYMRTFSSFPKILTIVCLALTAITLTACDKDIPQEPIDPIYTGVDDIMNDTFGGRNRAILALIEDGKVVYRRTYGKITYNQHVNVESASKWVAAVVIMNLVDKGVLDLDDPVSRFYTEFAGQERGQITLRQLLSQTSGIVNDHSCLNNLFGSTQDCGLGILYADTSFPAGTRFEMGLGSMQVAGGMAVRAYGKNWQDMYREIIKFPMKMVHMDYEYGEYYYLPNARIGDGLYSSAEDFSNFMIMLMNGGSYAGDQIISAESMNEMFSNQLGTTPVTLSADRGYMSASNELQQFGYGLGVWIEQINPFTGKTRRVSGSGTFGFIPWMDLETRNGGVLIVPGDFDDAWSAYQNIRSELTRIGK
jgi:CubicO group peptidase (beta-lactamase class C family)